MPDIFFAINGITFRQGPGPLSIASPPNGYDIGGGKKIIIVGVDANHPPVIIADDATDKLMLQNAVITTSTPPIDNVKFAFWMQFASLVTGAVTYSIGGSGNFFKKTPIAGEADDWIVARGTVETTVLGTGLPAPPLHSPPSNPLVCTEKLTRCANHQPGNWGFSLAAPNGGFKVSHDFGGASGNPTLGGGANDLKAEFWIHLEKDTNKLTITAAPGIRVKFGPPGDGGPGDAGEEERG